MSMMNLREQCLQRIAQAEQRKKEAVESATTALDDDALADALARNPQKALIAIAPATIQSVLRDNPPKSDNRHVWDALKKGCRQSARQVYVQACDLLAVLPSERAGQPANKEPKA